MGEVYPVRVPCLVGRNRCLQALDEFFQATRSVFQWHIDNADFCPASGEDGCMFAGDRVHQALYKEVIDVGSNIVVLKGKINRALDGEVVGFVFFVLRCSVT